MIGREFLQPPDLDVGLVRRSVPQEEVGIHRQLVGGRVFARRHDRVLPAGPFATALFVFEFRRAHPIVHVGVRPQDQFVENLAGLLPVRGPAAAEQQHRVQPAVGCRGFRQPGHIVEQITGLLQGPSPPRWASMPARNRRAGA